MGKKTTPKPKIAKRPLKAFYVPAVGVVKAADLSEVGEELNKKQEQDNGNK